MKITIIEIIPDSTDTILVPIIFKPKIEIAGTVKYTYKGGEYELENLKEKGKDFPYSSFPVNNMEYALYPLGISSALNLGGTVSIL
ncbi:MAG: hypothetical protein Q7R77_02910 [Candidatus Daviesbacteria bacterium]|nr:hypothetical protein [Candidatus Daviesbacteria bacterium]